MRLGFSCLFSVISFLATGLLRAGVGNLNPTGPSGSFNGNVTTGCSYDVFTGNAMREVTDIVVPGAVGSYPLAFTRVSNSRGFSEEFGSPGAWRHSYNWEIDGSEGNSSNQSFTPTVYPVYFPDGRIINFTYSSTDPYFRGPPGVPERFQPLDPLTLLAYLVLPDGGRIEFKASRMSECNFELHPPCNYTYSYKAQAIIDPYGQRTALAYNGDGTLNTVTEPGGRWLQLVYVTTPWNNGFGSPDRVIDHVDSSDGRSVKYNYGLAVFSPGTLAYTYLGNVVYNGDSALTAVYSYQAPNTGSSNSPPLLSTCSDLMYAGPMKNIRYIYATGTNGDNSAVVYGQIRYEKSLDGQVVSNLQVITSGRAEQKGDGSTRYFDFPANGYQVSNWSDFINFLHRANKTYDPTTRFLSSFTDRNGNTTNISSDPLTGNIKLVTYPLTPPDSTRASVTYTYGGPACPDPNNRDGNNPYYLYSVKDERDYETRYIRDPQKRIVRIEYPDNSVETFGYNGLGQVVSHRLRAGGLETFTYDVAGRLTEYRDAYHLATVDTQNPGVPANATPSAAYTYHIASPQLDRIRTVTDARGGVTTFDQYNFRGQPSIMTHPAAESPPSNIQWNYNTDGTLQWRRDEYGFQTSYSYDDYKRIASVTLPPRVAGSPSPTPTKLYYDHTGGTDPYDYSHTDSRPNRLCLPSQKMTKNVYDFNGMLLSKTIVGANGVDDAATTTYSYDFDGNLKTVKDPMGQSSGLLTEYFYDARSRQIHLDDPLLNDPIAPHRNSNSHSVSWTYDKAGNKLSQMGSNNQLISFAWNPMNSLLQQDAAQTPAPLATTRYSYDSTGLLKTMRDPRLVAGGSGDAYTYSYDLMGRKTRTDYPAAADGISRFEQLTYDTAGNVSSYTNRAGAVQTFSYDPRNRPTSSFITNGVGAPPVIEYDRTSRIIGVVNANASVHFGYYADGKLGNENDRINGVTGTRAVVYDYDADGNRSKVVYPSGKTYSYGYYGRNDLWYILDDQTGFYQAAYVYDLNGAITTRYVGFNWIVTDASQRNAMNQIKHLEHRFTNTTRSFDYTYNSAGNPSSIRKDGVAVESYSYDLAQQLTAGTESGGAATYGYDANGNRTALGGGGSYAINNLNQHTLFDGISVGYDAGGNVSSYGEATYVYDAFNLLKSVVKNGVTSTFRYDGLGRKVSQTVGGVTTYNVWDGWNLIEERNASMALLNTYIYGARGEPIERVSGATNRFYFQDAADSTSHFAEESGALLESYKYTSFGQQVVSDPNGVIRPAGSNYDVRHSFTGQLWMPQTGLYDYRRRVYSPGLTRFLQPDPIGFRGDATHLYRYCGNDPINRKDPMGTDGFFIPRDGEVEKGSNYMMNEYGLVPQAPDSFYAAQAAAQMQQIESVVAPVQRIVDLKVNIDLILAEHVIEFIIEEKGGIMLPKILDPDLYDRSNYAPGAREGGSERSFFDVQQWMTGYSRPNPAFQVKLPGETIEYAPLPNEPYEGGSTDFVPGYGYGPYGSATAAAAAWEASWGTGSAWGVGGGGKPLGNYYSY